MIAASVPPRTRERGVVGLALFGINDAQALGAPERAARPGRILSSVYATGSVACCFLHFSRLSRGPVQRQCRGLARLEIEAMQALRLPLHIQAADPDLQAGHGRAFGQSNALVPPQKSPTVDWLRPTPFRTSP